MINHEYTDEQKDKIRTNFINRLKSSDRLNTSIQVKIDDLLKIKNIDFEREKPFDYYSVDNYLSDYNLIVEVMGDYWHASPLKYNNDTYLLNQIQQKGIHRDKLKASYIKNNYHINILYLWEYDINNNIDMCNMLIDEYISSNGLLSNYHSFNYHIENNKLVLNDEIIIPYQDKNICDYKHLIK